MEASDITILILGGVFFFFLHRYISGIVRFYMHDSWCLILGGLLSFAWAVLLMLDISYKHDALVIIFTVFFTIVYLVSFFTSGRKHYEMCCKYEVDFWIRDFAKYSIQKDASKLRSLVPRWEKIEEMDSYTGWKYYPGYKYEIRIKGREFRAFKKNNPKIFA